MRRFPKAKIKCEECGKEFETLYKWRNKIFCNRTCYEKNRSGTWEKHKKEIISLYKQGYGIFTLEEKFGVNHDTIWRKMKELGIPPNPNSRSLSKNMLDLSPSEDLWYVTGCCYGDASVYSYQHHQCENAKYHRLEMTCKDRDFIEAFNDSCKKIGLNTHSINKKPSKTALQGFLWKVCVDSKAFQTDWWDKVSDEQVLNTPMEFKIPFMRGIFDSDGCFSNRRITQITTANEERANFLKNLIMKMGFKAAIYKSEYKNYQVENPKSGFKSNNPFKYSIYIRGGKSEVQRFLEMIEPNIARKRWAG